MSKVKRSIFSEQIDRRYGPTVGEVWDKEERQRRAEEARKLEDARADSAAVWPLADYYLPADWKEMAERWGMKETIAELWRVAFIEGWRARSRFIATRK